MAWTRLKGLTSPRPRDVSPRGPSAKGVQNGDCEGARGDQITGKPSKALLLQEKERQFWWFDEGGNSKRKYGRTSNPNKSHHVTGSESQSEIDAYKMPIERLGGPLLHSGALDSHISPQKGGGGEEGRDVPSGGEQEVDARRTENRHVTGGEPNGCEEEPIWVPGKSVNRVRHTQALSNMSRYKDPGAHSVTPSPSYAAVPMLCSLSISLPVAVVM
ncbi:hypothetical protein DFP72DRAFT_907229 [Ephemerocybe angulata]|uniref:Uncharacterized protein n=1 Tax=Ephemerocybe angulata TaxID=980116 RepID=A0A8H6M353_9AGAR|nr:hypothetical protein DFP72DRAFT_907229 [Tulosesus angulatus]